MGASGHYVHRIKNAVTQEFSNAYDIGKKLTIQLNKDITDGGSAEPIKRRRIFSGNIQLIRLKGTISGGATQITIKGYGDASGTELLLPPSTGVFEQGVSGTTRSVVFKVDIFHASPTDELYLFCKTNTGTFTVTEVQVAWYE